MDFKEKLFTMIKSLKTDVFTLRSLYKKLGFYTAFEKREVDKAIKELVTDGALVAVGEDKFALKAAKAQVFSASVRGNRRGFAFITDENGGEFFVPHRGLHGAMHGDTVVAKRVPNTQDEAEVVSVSERGVKTLVGTFAAEKTGAGFVIPDDDSFFSDVYVPFERRNSAKNGDKVVVKITGYKKGKNPDGQIIERLGKKGTVKGETLAIIRSHGFLEEFTPEAVDYAQKAAHPLTARDTAGRKDFTGLLTITIDGEDARDFDDAVSIEKIQGGYRLYVHIADVSHYVKTGSALDKDALKRTTSVYLPNMVLPMLPEVLSNGMCSLMEGQIRLTLSVTMDVDFNGKVTASEINESIIRSAHRMTYTKVQKMLEGDGELLKEYADLGEMVKNMSALASILNRKRAARGSINFAGREAKITLNDDGTVADIQPYPIAESNNIIEEFMILANETVAEFMFHTELPFIYRTHEPPQTEKLDALKTFVQALGYSFAPRQKVYPADLQKLLDEVQGKPEETIVSKVMLRSMQKAKYTVNNIGHFGLASDYYCHFTSPIRRYPDLMIHRVIKQMLEGKAGEAASDKTRALCQSAAAISSEREVAAEQAERDADDYFKAVYMEDKIGEVYEGIISGVTSFGIFVELFNTVEGLIALEVLPPDRYEYIEAKYQLKGAKRSYSLGDRITVQVTRADRELRRVDFEPYEKGEQSKQPRGRHK